MPKEDRSQNQKPTLTFVLVHGTFGRGAPWVENEAAGSFRDQLRREFSADYLVQFETVDWGEPNRLKRYFSDNTLTKRFKGAASLARHLHDSDDESDTDRRYLIAHSHGGSVVMYALTDPEVHNKVSGIICLSSPFLHYQYAKFHRDLLLFSALVLTIIAADAGNALIWAYTTVYVLVAGTVLATKNFGQTLQSIEKLEAQRLRVKIPKKDQLLNTNGEIPFLAVRPHRDEVTSLFWFTQNTGHAFRILWQFVNTVGRWGLFGFLLVRLIQWGVEKLLPKVSLTALDGVMSLVDQHFMTPIMLVATAVLLGMVVMRLSYAFDSLPWLAMLDPKAKILPWDDADAVAVDTFGFVAHTSVQQQAPPKIIKWIRHSHQVDPRDRITP